ncbi:phosphoglucosamine mutase (plasmid) [Halostagnicola larsenii XH-48]|uniref:Phosphoglucosamine mutase n=1 Tax=Halostagnicola larsenii XH-48 TaxID=797299 RepID=W0JV42_9EURY|nr:phosphoglucosamine mutase [Halostagnicola larsenii]AHG02441.1 phosphoglucosamine mutase [Halostagnicola larsenii XH-48]
MFGTSGIRGRVGEDVTAALALEIGRALGSEGYDRVVIGRDSRDSGSMLLDAIAAGLCECGADALEIKGEIAATPTIARAVGWADADAGVVVTASHNPPEDNGIKLWTPSGKAFGPDRRAAIVERVESEAVDSAAWDETGDRTTLSGATESHASAIRSSVNLREPLSVVVDVGNGAGQITATVLEQLGCTVRTLNAQPDGSFPGRPSEPTAETLESLETLVGGSDADLGVAHDGDADRMMAVDETGTFVPKDSLLALFAREEVGDGDRVAAPVDTSLAVEDALAARGGSLVRTKVGDVFVAQRATDADVVFGGEPSGAWIWPEETLCPDGPLAAAKLVELVAASGPLSSLESEIDSYPIRRGAIESDDKSRRMDDVERRVLETYDDVDNRDGVRVETEDGWFLLRASGTQPIIRVTAQARESGRAAQLYEEATELVGE